MPKILTKKEEYYKRARTEAMAWLGKMYCLENALSGDALTIERRLELERLVKWIHGALELLTEEERRILLCIADGCSVMDLCELFSREKSTIYAIRKRAIDRLTMALYGCWEDKRHG